MLNRILDTYQKLASGRMIFLLLFLFLLTNFVIGPTIYPKFRTLDTLPSYTPEEAYHLISSYGEQGRQYYAVIEVTLDLVYPFVTALMFGLMILYTFNRAFPGKNRVQKLALAPFAVMLADYVENACVLIMLRSYPRESSVVAQIANLFTMTKFVLSPLQLLFVVGLIGWLIQAIRKRRQS